MSARLSDRLAAEVKLPSQLTAEERTAWLGFMERMPSLQRAFFTPAFAEACEQTHGRARVAVLRQGGETVGFFPFQYETRWHQRIGLAERIGGALCDNAGVVGRTGLRLAPNDLLRLCGIGRIFITELGEEQAAFGLTVADWRVGHGIELPDGSAAYFAGLLAANKTFVLDTERKLRRLERDYGPAEYSLIRTPSIGEVTALIAAKRTQYARNAVGDPFNDPAHLRLVETLATCTDPTCVPVLNTLSAGGRVLAQHFGLLHSGVLSYWFPVYDPEASKVSPGRLLLWHMIHAADMSGIRLIDLGEGDTQLKRDFSTAKELFGRAVWHAGGWRGMLARGYQKLTWMLRR